MKKLINFILLTITTMLTHSIFANSPENSMKDNQLTVIINKSIQEVFDYTTDPNKTPQWIDSVAEEQTDEHPPRVGTIYKNRGKTGPWSVYKVSKYTYGKEFELIKEDDSTYHVNYTYSTCPDGATKLVYHEWVTKGAIDGPFTQDILDKLKEKLEADKTLKP